MAFVAFVAVIAPHLASSAMVAAAMCVRVDLEQRAQVLARVAPTEPVGAERQEVRRQPAGDHVGHAFIQSVAAMIGPPSWGRILLTYGIRGVLASGWSRFHRSAASASRRSSWNDGAL